MYLTLRKYMIPFAPHRQSALRASLVPAKLGTGSGVTTKMRRVAGNSSRIGQIAALDSEFAASRGPTMLAAGDAPD